MLTHLTLKDFVIVDRLDLDFGAGFGVLTGETGAGKSILIDALQLALGARAEAVVVREGAARADIAATFDTPASLRDWLDEAGFDGGESLLLRRLVDAQGKSRAFINGSPATVAQLREVADHLVDIHGQHAWQGLTRPAAVRALLDEQAGVDTRAMTAAFATWQQASQALAQAQARQGEIGQERERLQWQINELQRLAPGSDEWPELNEQHQRLSHGQSLIDAAQQASQWLSEADINAHGLIRQAIAALDDVVAYDTRLAPVADELRSAQAQLEDATHTLGAYLSRAEIDPGRLAELDARLSAWMGLARRLRRPPQELPATLAQWQAELQALDDSADLDALADRVRQAEAAWRTLAEQVSRQRRPAAEALAQRVTAAMQQLGMAGGQFEVALVPQDSPQSFGLESVEFRVAGHAGSTPRALAKVASGGELSRLALAIAVTTAQHRQSGPATLIFDEIDAGVGGTVADTVGQLMRQLGRSVQVLAVTHLPQVAAGADHHLVVAKQTQQGRTLSQVRRVSGPERLGEVARMLGGERASSTSLAHAQALIHQAAQADTPQAAP